MSHRSEIVYGYHGCDESVAKRILEGRDPLTPSYNAYDWLGSGIYFWEDAPERAMQWAVRSSPAACSLQRRTFSFAFATPRKSSVFSAPDSRVLRKIKPKEI